MVLYTKIASYNAPCVVLGKERLWWVFLLSSICTPFILATLVGLVRLAIYFREDENRHRILTLVRNQKLKALKLKSFYRVHAAEEIQWIGAIRGAADRIVSDRYVCGRILTGLAFVFSMCSLFIYYNSVSYTIRDVEWCRAWLYNEPQQVDFAFNCFFLVYFILRFLAVEDKISFIFNLYSIIDYFTVPPAFVGLILDRDWIGLKFLRVLYLRRLPALLSALGIMNSTSKIKLMQLGLTWIAILLAAGGLFHLVENSGDPFYEAFDGQRVSYWDFCYFAFGTMATLGSADVNVKTVLGKLTNCFLVMIVLAVIALALPDVADLLGNRRKYSGEHRSAHNEKHVVLCGYVTHATTVEIFNEFFHPDRNIQGIKLVCLDPTEPDMDFTRFIKKNRFQIGYLQGGVLVPADCYRAKIHEADAVLILADIATSNAEAEDSNNIMRVVAVKNYHPKVRIIVQLLQYRSKSYLTSIPNWDPKVGDDVVCLPEIKLGLLAQSCVAPGFSTLMANIFASRSSDTSDENPPWLNEYLTGAGMEMYTSLLSHTFDGLSFEAVAEICYLKLNILLIGLAKPLSDGGSFFSLQFILNPPNFMVTSGTTGCFLADSAKDAERALHFCKLCHDDVTDPEFVKPCNCGEAYDNPAMEGGFPFKSSTRRSNGDIFGRARTATNIFSMKRREARANISIPNGSIPSPPDPDEPESGPATITEDLEDRISLSTTHSEQRQIELEKLERTYFTSFEKKIVYFMRHFGSMAAWNKNINEPIVDEEGHVLRLTTEPRFDSTGMFWWCPPKPFDEILMDRFQAARRNFSNHIVLIVFAGDTTSAMGLNNFVQALRSSTTRYEDLHDIVILSDPRFLALEWNNLMSFPKVYLVKVFGLNRADLRAVNIHMSQRALLLTATTGLDGGNSLLSDKDSILTSLTIKAMNFGISDDAYNDAPIATSKPRYPPDPTISVESALLSQAARGVMKTTTQRLVVPGLIVPLLTELLNDVNVQFIEQDDVDAREFFMAEPFACGHAFATSVLQSLLVTMYFNPFMLNILRHMIFGGITPEFEQILAEGAGLIGGPNLSETEAFTDRCILQQISLKEPRYATLVGRSYEELFLTALRHHQTICLGLYRLIAPDAIGPRSIRRFVICNPPRDCRVLASDRVFVIERAAHHLEEQLLS